MGNPAAVGKLAAVSLKDSIKVVVVGWGKQTPVQDKIPVLEDILAPQEQ